MSRVDRITARYHLDRRLRILRDSDAFPRPPRGWIKAIREALGMTSAQLARRLGVSQPRIIAVEKAEADRSITLASLERTARALNCHVVYALVPNTSLAQLIEERADHLARSRMESTRHTMLLEGQQCDPADEKQQLRRMTRILIEKSGSELWDTDYS